MKDIKSLMNIIRELEMSRRNQQLNELWEEGSDRGGDHWRGIPASQIESNNNITPVMVELEVSMWSKILDFDLYEYFRNPEIFVKAQLEMMIYKFNELQDDTPVRKTIDIWLGSSFEMSLFGVKTRWLEGQEPWIGKEPIIKEETDLDKISRPDFYNTGMMPQAHRLYEGCCELLDEDFTVNFPNWIKGPFGIAIHLMGMDNLLIALHDNPKFVKKLLELITNLRKAWTIERCRFLNMKIEPAILDNDEVNSPLLSTEMYKNFVVPLEKDLADFHGGIAYWHSCGDISLLLSEVLSLGPIAMLHVSPWTDISKVMNIFKGTETAFEICMHPVKDVLTDRQHVADNISTILNKANGSRFTIRADSLHNVGKLQHDIILIKRWVEITKRLCQEYRI